MIARALYIVVGVMAAGLGLVGVWVPGLPTTPFVLLALFCLARGSRRLHEAVRKNKYLSEAVKQADEFEKNKTVAWRVKIISVGCAWGSAAAVWLGNGGRWNALTMGVLAAAMVCTVAMAVIKTTPRPPRKKPRS